ncbi:MAG: type IV secretion protein Rhs, partial [Blastocatellia bacterium]|nr:type IV secretion protein Rhs [Blastocatellia bacterium]
KKLSGWNTAKSPTPEGFTQIDPQEILDLQEEMGFPAKRSGAMDQGKDGKYFASHAERQASVLCPDQPIEVSDDMCPNCHGYFQALANYRGVDQQVTDPRGTHNFYPQG